MNSVHLTGRLTKDPEVRKSTRGNDCVHFTLAVRRRFHKKDDKDSSEDQQMPKQNADFISCVAWNGIARVIGNNCKKGSRIGITGPLQSRSYETNGTTKYLTEVRVNELDIFDFKEKEELPESDLNGTSVNEEEMDIY
ncbi:single-stranded DNA-binding protein [Selenomonas ruminantium]|uniref:single-stranded DNA-binding protein n=1 Tax=Selenomonas ruminantium TaxID=971 RepID=UPI0026F06A2E|nr:single-stranded DNA-binding protein [Selenomonas ruminantium]